MLQQKFGGVLRSYSVPRRRIWALPVAALGSVLLHGLLILPFVLGASAAKRRVPNAQGAGSSATASSAEPMMTMIMIDAPVITRDPDVLPEDIASLGLHSNSFTIKIISPDSTPAFDPRIFTTDQDALNPIPEAAGDTAGRAQLFGRYMGQVIARIERAWVRPRNPIADPLFQCRVQIGQDKQGNVLEVMIVECNGDGDWKASLANAIQSASPLPAPPDPSVFADALTLSFDAEPFQKDGSGEGFEPEPVQVASTGTFGLGPVTSEILNRKSQPMPGVIELHISGKHDDSLDMPQVESGGAQSAGGIAPEPDAGASVQN